ncbi:MAG: ribokinase [Planctomycetaceae bacterium]|nr:ribokinase [Planctomycetaceae bacterium]
MVQTPRIVVVGSINMDLVARVPHLPRPGETVRGSAFSQVPGGKGANQAVAAALLGADVTMIGRVGNDAFGQQLLASLKTQGVHTKHVHVTPDCPSGLALIGVEDSGQNVITVIGGANERLTPEDVQASEAAIADADALLVQLEVPLQTVVAAVQLAAKHGALTILDPAPAPAAPLPAELYGVDLISPNQSEAEALTGIAVVTMGAAQRAAAALHERGVKRVVIKLGERGAFASEIGGEAIQLPAPQVNVVDTTAAGDAFTAALAVALVDGRSLADATRFACTAGSLATTRPGGQDAMPLRAEVLGATAGLPSSAASTGGQATRGTPKLSP